MSKELDQLEAELSQCHAERRLLQERERAIEDKISEQRLVEWLQYKGIDTRTFPLNSELRDFIIENGFPGGDINRPEVLEAWAIGNLVTIEGISKSEQSIKVAPSGHHPGLFPPDMVVRAIKGN